MNYFAKARWIDGCLVWQGCLDDAGYGRTSYLGRRGITAHRAVWLQAGREIPPGCELDHYRPDRDRPCESRACIYLAHLRTVPHGENMRNRVRDRSRCKYGHPKRPLPSTGRLYCPLCSAEFVRRNRAARRA